MKDNTGLACFGLAVLAVIAIPLAAITNGWALSILWGWFVSPVFGIGALSVPYAIGLSVVVGMLSSSQSSSDNKDKSTASMYATLFSQIFLRPAFALLVGWVTLGFV